MTSQPFRVCVSEGIDWCGVRNWAKALEEHPSVEASNTSGRQEQPRPDTVLRLTEAPLPGDAVTRWVLWTLVIPLCSVRNTHSPFTSEGGTGSRDIKELAENHPAKKWQSLDMNLVSLVGQVCTFFSGKGVTDSSGSSAES